MKIAGQHIAHKTEIGGVSGKLETTSEIIHAYESILAHAHRALSTDEISGVTIGRYIMPSPSLELFF
jgi:acyl-CoA synthetase (NDP forming)